ncbi:septal ring lytic transglycosylase RlpA family protein [Methylobacterium mesophilicum]|uniref:septal ring lytic transglycosylase RlpA family protein n=1 Tax=Methylobacterium mesophilicum TaxID=39956 RepID=UPI002F36100B
MNPTMVRTTLPRPARLALRLMAVSGVALATANCATSPQQKLAAGNGIDPKYGVKASPRLYNEGDVIPKGGGRRYTGKPYVVAGQTYVPKENPSGYVREGLASWYGAAFHGRMTANGEVFDRHSIAAAHPTLPLPSYARVTNLDNGYSMLVRVNDRGPYHAGRVMDVSEEAADALGFHRKGTARVRVEYVGKASVAGSDDRKLLASLRTDGRPAGRSTVMVADLGPNEDTERYTRSAPALAFRPAQEAEEAEKETGKETGKAPAEAPAARPERTAPVRAPIVLAAPARKPDRRPARRSPRPRAGRPRHPGSSSSPRRRPARRPARRRARPPRRTANPRPRCRSRPSSPWRASPRCRPGRRPRRPVRRPRQPPRAPPPRPPPGPPPPRGRPPGPPRRRDTPASPGSTDGGTAAPDAASGAASMRHFAFDPAPKP